MHEKVYSSHSSLSICLLRVGLLIMNLEDHFITMVKIE